VSIMLREQLTVTVVAIAWESRNGGHWV